MANKNFPSIQDFAKTMPGATVEPYTAADVLDRVMSAGEVADVYKVKHNTVNQAAKRGAVKARKSGNVWLIDRADAIRMWAAKGAVRGTICLLIPTIATAVLAIAAY